MKNTLLPILAVGCLVAAPVQTAFCQGTTYISRPAFQAALSSTTTITFEDLPVTPDGIGESSITNSGATFTAGALLFIRDSFSPVPATGKFLKHFDGSNPVSILLPNGVTAFGADFSGGSELNRSYNATLTVNLVGGQAYAYNFTGTYAFWTFFGVTFPQPIASLIYDDGPIPPFLLHEELLDNVTIGVVPEPSSFGLLALGSLLLGWRARCRLKPHRRPHNLPAV
jgi:hypothetical protein